MSYHALTKVVDAVVIPTGLSAPWWVQYMTTWLGWFAAICAAIVGAGRVLMMIRDWRSGKQDR